MGKLSESFNDLDDFSILENVQIIENYLTEASWRNKNQFENHYKDHVLSDGEEFDPSNPKFVNMPQSEYVDMAETISNFPANRAVYKTIYNDDGTVQRRIMNDRSNVIGFILKPDSNKYKRVKRKAKIVVTPDRYLPNGVSGKDFRTLVIYVDDLGEDEIVSCYLLRPNKLRGLINYQFESELPENQD